MAKLSELTLEELVKRKSTIKGALIGLISLAVIIALLFAYLYFIRGKHISIGALIPLLVLPITWVPIIVTLKSLEDELKLRKTQEVE